MEFTTRFGLHSQATRLEGAVRSRDAATADYWPGTICGYVAPFKGDLDRRVRPGNEAGPYATTLIRAATRKRAARFSVGLGSCSLAATGEITVVFFSSAY